MATWKENEKFFLQIQIWKLPCALVCSHLHLHLFCKAENKHVTLTYLSEKDGNTGQGPEHKTDVLFITEISWVSTSALTFLLWIRWRNKRGASHTSEPSAKQPRKTSGLQETSHYLKLMSLQQKLFPAQCLFEQHQNTSIIEGLTYIMSNSNNVDTHSSVPRLTSLEKLRCLHQDFHSFHMICRLHVHTVWEKT